ncbi:hypothetical protein EVAR_82700_1 [Eumeta japonica]|uniref:Uncharacterized protein n=1 Tax=Eumeta variegata TaxID=151549 RepID=A0A4C1VDR3_EUMVA|nr:hypothetical protein EVAR_82700_1 [Eumeta japonica]
MQLTYEAVTAPVTTVTSIAQSSYEYAWANRASDSSIRNERLWGLGKPSNRTDPGDRLRSLRRYARRAGLDATRNAQKQLHIYALTTERQKKGKAAGARTQSQISAGIVRFFFAGIIPGRSGDCGPVQRPPG